MAVRKKPKKKPAQKEDKKGEPQEQASSTGRDWQSLLSTTLIFLAVWLLGFAVLRVFCIAKLSEDLVLSGSMGGLLVQGLVPDVLGFAVIFPIWLAVRWLTDKVRLGRFAMPILLLAALILGVINALVLSWSHSPLDPAIMKAYADADSISKLSTSALGSLPNWPWTVGAATGVVLMIAAAVWWSLQEQKLAKKAIPASRLPWVGLLVLAAGGLSLWQGYSGEQTSQRRAVAENTVWHFAKALVQPADDEITMSNSAGFFNLPQDEKGLTWAQKIRRRLVTDQGSFEYLDEQYPLVKRNTSFCEPDQRAVKWDGLGGKRPNIVMLFMESFRAFDIGAYGSTAGLTPNFDRLSKDGWLWENFYANGMQTPRGALAALCSILPRMADPEMGKQAIGRSDPNFPLKGLAEILKEQGYRTEYYHNGSLTFDNKEAFFRNLGFDHIYGMKALDPQRKYDYGGKWGYGDVIFAGQLAERLNKYESDEPLFLTAFTVTTHHPWRVPDPKLKIVPETGGQYPKYQNCIYYSDYAIGTLFKKLNKKVIDNTIFIILADTATPMGEHHKNFTLMKYLYEENYRIPFLVYAPGYIRQGRRFMEVASQVDIAPTLLDMLQFQCDNAMIGRSLLSKSEDSHAVFNNPYHSRWVGIRKGDYKYILQLNGNEESLYNLVDDPGERNNIIVDNRQIADVLRVMCMRKIEATQDLVKNNRIWSARHDAAGKEAAQPRVSRTGDVAGQAPG